MRFDWPEDLATFRDEVRAYAQESRATRPRDPWAETDEERDAEGSRNLQELDRLGWLRLSWPESIGGQGKSPWFQFLVALELSYYEVEFGRMGTASMVGPAIEKFGTDQQRRDVLPKIWSGEITNALGYSEPDAGSDLASLRTRAVRDGEQYVINGSKIWTSNAHHTTHVFLACRTDPSAPKHRGISLFLVPLNTPGITIRPIWVMSGHRTNEVHFDEVRVPLTALMGEENRGWYILTNALDHERITIGATNYIDLVQVFEWSIDYMRKDRPDILADPIARAKLADLKLDLHMLRGVIISAGSVLANGGVPTKEGSMGKVLATELCVRMTSAVMDLIGRDGVQDHDSAEPSPVEGRIEQIFRRAPIPRFAGGANEIQKTIIAERGLGLPRGN